MLIKNATILNDRFQFQVADLVVSTTIDQIIPQDRKSDLSTAAASSEETIDLDGDLLIPGLVDIHTHGAVGVDAMDEDLDYVKWRSYLLGNGITTFFPATVTEDMDRILKTLENLKQAEGVYLEGPFLNPEKNGAHDKAKITPADLDFIKSVKDQIRFLAIAPEVPGNLEAVQAAVSMGIRVVLAHSSANYETGRKAFENGASQLTHTFNAMNPLTHREPNLVGAALDNETVYCEVISDGVHLHPAIIRILFRILGAERMILISDSMSATGYPDGHYLLGGLDITVKDQIAHTAYGAIAGSTTNLMGMVRKAVSFGIPLADAVQMASLTPARAAGLENQIGSITVGKKANLVRCDKDLAIRGVFYEGQKI